MNSLARTIIVGLISLMLLGALVFEIYLLKKTENEIASTIASADTEIGDDSRLRGIVELQGLVVDDLEVFEEAILTRSDLVSVIESLEKMGKDMGLSVSITSLVNENAKGAQSAEQLVRVSIEAVGTWDKNITFVRMLENLPHKISIEKTELSLNGSDWRTSASIKLSTYPER